MRLRSLNFVATDSERRFAKEQKIGADLLIVDLPDSIAPSMEAQARTIVVEFGAQPSAGTIGIRHRRYDIPHLKAAQRTLAAKGDIA